MNIKVACPYNVVTGGIELLHQVAHELNKYDNIYADIWYIFDSNKTDIPVEYQMYGNSVNNVICPDDILLFPEIWAGLASVSQFAGHKKIIYWESVDNYFGHTRRQDWFKFEPSTIHLSQTEYSNRFLEQFKIPADNIIEVTDYINDEFFTCQDEPWVRHPIVLYNPVKGFEFTDKLIMYAPDIDFQPISGMNRQQIIELMRKSMVWVDFGNFPGKDRLPREAAICGMCLITGKHGSAKFVKDLAIPPIYKFSDANYSDLKFISQLIRDIFNQFEYHTQNFIEYREHIKEEKILFEQGVYKLVRKLCQ